MCGAASNRTNAHRSEDGVKRLERVFEIGRMAGNEVDPAQRELPGSVTRTPLEGLMVDKVPIRLSSRTIEAT